MVRNSSTKASQHRKITLYLKRKINHSFENATNRCRIRHRPPNRLWTKFGALRIKWNSSSWQINRIIHYSSARYSHCILSCHSTSSLGKFIFLLYYDIHVLSPLLTQSSDNSTAGPKMETNPQTSKSWQISKSNRDQINKYSYLLINEKIVIVTII